MIAYVFWHQPSAGVTAAAYEDAQRLFHASLDTPSACFRLGQLPFGSEGGYEDWYLVESWEGLGELNAAAVDQARRSDHDRAASMSAHGWGAVYALVQGPLAIPDEIQWLDKPKKESYEEFVGALPDATTWQRQLVLGPGPELCAAAPGSTNRKRIWPDS